MVIIAYKAGQLCNRLFQFSYFIVNGYEHKYKVVNPSFNDFAEFFESTQQNSFNNLSVSLKITPFKIIDRALIKFSDHYSLNGFNSRVIDIRHQNEIYNLNNQDFISLAKEKNIFVKGWLFKDETNLKKHHQLLNHIFKPKPHFSKEIESINTTLRKKYDVIVGVHMRRGDYKEWNDGKYYFADEVYLDKMLKLKSELNEKSQSCCFFIASNEDVCLANFKNIDVDYAKRHLMVDLYMLSACDYIIGPPSTFSLWAAFYGHKPFQIIDNENTEITLDKFVYY